MKKFLVAVMLVVVAGAGCFALSACNKRNPDRISSFRQTLEEAESFEMVCMMETADSGFRYTFKVDGNKTYESGFMDSSPVYTERIGPTIYTYTVQDNVWVVTSANVSITEEEEGAGEYLAIFDGNNYIYSKEEKAFVLKEDAAILLDGMGFVSLKVVIGENMCTLKGKVVAEGMLFFVTMEFINLNATQITLPQVNNWWQ